MTGSQTRRKAKFNAIAKAARVAELISLLQVARKAKSAADVVREIEWRIAEEGK